MSDDWEGFDRDQVVLRLNEAINVCGVLEDEIERLTAELAKHQEKCKALTAEVRRLRRWTEVMQPVCDAAVDLMREAHAYASEPHDDSDSGRRQP